MNSGDRLRALTPLDFALWVLRRRRRFCVENVSMLPTLEPGEEVLVDLGAYRQSLPRVGDIVVATPQVRPGLRAIKRVGEVLPDGQIFLLGDNPAESTDSRVFGAVAPKEILGRVTCRFA
ncbi:MAG: nickel-type superoxide dismutase maturation protease [Cyanobacteria bacterium J06641_5]